MSDQLEQEIRAALQRRAATLPPDAARGLTGIDYEAPDAARAGTARRGRPAVAAARTWLLLRPMLRRRWRMPALGAAVATLAAGIATAAVLLTSTAPVAYAGWSPIPTTPTASAVAAATAACDRAHHGGGLLGPAPSGKPVLTDARGLYTAAVYVSDGVANTCISSGRGHGTSDGATNLRLLAKHGVPKPGADQLGEPSGGGGTAPGFSTPHATRGGEMHVLGLAGNDITGVTFVFADRTKVQATVESGWYFAWWPYTSASARSYPTSVEVTTRSGRTRVSPMDSSACNAEPTCVFARLDPNLSRR